MIRILLVDDDAPQLQRMKQVLAKAFPNADINTALSLNKAIDKIAEQKAFSLIITDYLLAEQTDETGYKLLEYCQDHLTDVPVIIITAYGQDSKKNVRAARSFRKGAFDFMHKPLDFDEFIERVKRAITISEALS
jgi:DNA-binding NtrC family response regulator